MSRIDFAGEAAARHVEETYLTPDVVAQRARTLSALALRPGERVVDIGSGPGLLAHDMARLVGPSGRVAGLDPSPAMNAMAARRCADCPQASFEAGEATALPFAAASFDAAVTTQVLEYVADIPLALAEIARVLRPGGRVLIIDTAWDSVVVETSDRARNARVWAAWEGHLVHPNLPTRLAPDLGAAGFETVRIETIPMVSVGWQPTSYAGRMIDAVAGYAAGAGRLAPGEAEAWRAELAALSEAGRFYFSVDRVLFLAVRRG
ncbi:MAG: methyltransferase domain-containing protein [Alphaproteobacteria bacterium]|nr:methyltransferase domain-containing protein [Alphaproteobacteria bacterium]